MIVIESDNIVFFDCDDTLVMWGQYLHDPHLSVEFNNFGYSQWLLPNIKNIEQLKNHKLRNHKVVVWSAGGYEWALEVVNKLQLSNFVDVVMSKPQWFYDDLPSSEFMPESNRVYFNSKGERVI